MHLDQHHMAYSVTEEIMNVAFKLAQQQEEASHEEVGERERERLPNKSMSLCNTNFTLHKEGFNHRVNGT